MPELTLDGKKRVSEATAAFDLYDGVNFRILKED